MRKGPNRCIAVPAIPATRGVTEGAILPSRTSSDTVAIPVSAADSPFRRRLTVVVSFVSLFSITSLAPLPRAQTVSITQTVARTVDIPVASLGDGGSPSSVRVSSTTLRTLGRARTAPVSVCAPFWSTMVALAWRQWEGRAVSATVKTESGRPASVLDDQDARPDPGSPEYHADLRTSPLYWTGGGRC